MKSAMKSVSDFDEAMSKLDSLVASGWEKYKIAERAFQNASQEKPFTREAANKVLKEQQSIHNMWFEKVLHNIEQLTDRNYYCVLFINSFHSDGAWISGFGPQLSSFIICFENQLQVMSEILIMLEERRGTFIKQEIVQQEYDASHRYWLKYDEMSGKLYLNGTILIATTRLDWPADRLLRQVFEKPNELIELDGVKSSQVSSALRDIGMTGTLKKIFFPRTSGNKVMFRPFITNTEFVDEKLQDVSFAELRNNEK